MKAINAPIKNDKHVSSTWRCVWEEGKGDTVTATRKHRDTHQRGRAVDLEGWAGPRKVPQL